MLAGGSNWHKPCPLCVDPGAQWIKQPRLRSRWSLLRTGWLDRDGIVDAALIGGLVLVGAVLGFVLAVGP